MPYTRRRRVTTRRPKQYGQRKYAGYRRRVYNRRKNPIYKNFYKPYMFTKLRYVEDHLSMDSATGALTTHVFSANSLYDPDFTGVGHQPFQYDQLCGAAPAPYYKYTVTGVKASVTVKSDGDNPGNFVLTAYAVGSPSSIGLAAEQGLGISKYLGAHDSGRGIIRLSKYWSIGQLYGVSRKTVLSEDKFSAIYNADPVNIPRVLLMWQGDTTAAHNAIYCSIKLTYYCRLFQRNDVNQS